MEEGVAVVSSQILGRMEAGAAAPAEAVAAAVETTVATDSVEAKTSPAVRKALAESNLDKAAVSGSGKDGRILKEDVQAAAQMPSLIFMKVY